MQINLTLTKPQREFVFSEAKYPAFVGGFGAGKSESLVNRLIMRALGNPKGQVGYFAPTFDLIRLIAWPRFLAKCDEWGIRAKLNKTENILTFNRGGKVIFRTLDTPERIVGFEIADAGIDELDTLKKDHALAAWRAVNARCREKKKNGAPNTVAVGTTPEGFRLCYELWEQDPKPGFVLYRAPTSSNPYLPDDYVQQLMTQYPPHLLKAYLQGLFVNLASGSVYPDYDRKLNNTFETIEPGEVLHIGLDFNVGNCTAVVFVIRNGLPYALAELTKIRDTPAMCVAIREMFPKDRWPTINIYPDASGQQGKSNGADSDLVQLQQAGFILRLNPGKSGGYYNPSVKDRVASLNALILNSNGVRRLMVNVLRCPQLAMCLEQQVYDANGEPEKGKKAGEGKDHSNDAAGYFSAYNYPIVRPVSTQGARNFSITR